jgi:hypothetical protein
MCAWAVDIDLGEDGETDAIILRSECANLRRVPRFLASELVARKAQHGKSAVFVGAIERFKTGVLGCKSTIAGGIDYQQNPSLEFAETEDSLVQQGGREFINGLS